MNPLFLKIYFIIIVQNVILKKLKQIIFNNFNFIFKKASNLDKRIKKFNCYNFKKSFELLSIKRLNTLILGPIGAGKSSFINSTLSVLRNKFV